MPLATVPEIIEELRQGRFVVMVDRHDRENEGDLVIATQTLTSEAVSFMMREGRGLICISIPRERALELKFPYQVDNNTSQFSTPFTVSVSHRSVVLGGSGQSLGMTASSRAQTMLSIIDPNCRPQDFVVPGHVFPLVANPAGVLGRDGHTEVAVDLARMAGFYPSGVICEVLNSKGQVARGQELRDFAKRNNFKIGSVADVIRYRIATEVLIREVAKANLNTDHGRVVGHVFQNDVDKKEHAALIYGDVKAGDVPLVRIHSECLTGDVFGSRRCDCGQQLLKSIEVIKASGSGIVLYLRQEGRGIGLLNKLKAYHLQDNGDDTVEANIKLGFSADERDFVVAAKILLALGVSKIRLLTNNPEKMDTVRKSGIEIVERMALDVQIDELARGYIDAKRTKLGHLL